MPRHGTTYHYDLGCRCSLCKSAKNAKRREARARARAEGRDSYRKELAGARALKGTYRGRCETCGAPTTGCNGKDAAPKVCADCAPSVYGPRYAVERRGTGPVSAAAVAFFVSGGSRLGLVEHLGITEGHASVLINRLLRYGLVRRVGRGQYETVASRKAAA